MKINQAEFVLSAVGPAQFPEDGLPEIALAGRSNVGKSSLINRMINRKNLARTSQVPGKTQTLNYYRINQDLFFVDLPGYGYAKVSKTLRAQWGKMIENYLLSREQLRVIIQIIDLRHPPTADDKAMFEWLGHFGIPTIIVTTKADKIPKTHWSRHQKVIRQDLNIDDSTPFILFSSETGLGRDELWKTILEFANHTSDTDNMVNKTEHSP